MHYRVSILIGLAVILSCQIAFGQQKNTRIESQAGAQIDCTKIKLEYKDNPSLTKEENVALMDAALLRSLEKYDYCQNNRPVASGGGGGGGGGASAGGGGGSGISGSGSASASNAKSVASTDLTGTNTASSNSGTAASSQQIEEKQKAEQSKQASVNELPPSDLKSKELAKNTYSGSGKTPEDIPPADNDSVLEAQIRQAAMQEKDPVIQEKLWNEYRKYKGLPAKK